MLLEWEQRQHAKEISVAFWKELYANSRMPHMRIDVVGKELGILFLPQLGVVALMGGMT